MCPLPARCQKFDLRLYFLTYSDWWRYRLPSGAAPEGSGETEHPTQRPSEAGTPTQRSGEVEPTALRLGDVEPVCLGVRWSCSRTLDCSDESMLMVISSSSLGTLVISSSLVRSKGTSSLVAHAV